MCFSEASGRCRHLAGFVLQRAPALGAGDDHVELILRIVHVAVQVFEPLDRHIAAEEGLGSIQGKVALGVPGERVGPGEFFRTTYGLCSLVQDGIGRRIGGVSLALGEDAEKRGEHPTLESLHAIPLPGRRERT